MKKILVVEDSDMVMKILRHLMQSTMPSDEAYYAANFSQAQALCDHHDFFAALVDLNLPDAPDGEVVDFVLSKKIPTIVFTGQYDDQHRDQLFAKGVVDYVTKEGRYAYSRAIALLQRLEKNQGIKVLVVDDSDVSRKHMTNLLRRHLFQVLEAGDGMEAIKVLLDNPEIKLLIVDFNMPRMDGFELVKNLRYKYHKTDLLMIGVSDESGSSLPAKFIKQGANDFLRKPFNPEEFYCRVIHCIESAELVEQINQNSRRDYLTRLFHRPYFFSAAQELYSHAKEKSSPLSLAVINIDKFNAVNLKFGNLWGDVALQQIAEQLETMLGRFLLARLEGDAFCVLMPGLDNEKAVALLDKVKQLLAAEAIQISGEPQHFSFSAGVTNNLLDTFDQQFAQATRYMYRAKDAGGQMIVDDHDEAL
jgi:diguanylate cyclase (GGDEF)-like protein